MRNVLIIVLLAALAGCATPPSGESLVESAQIKLQAKEVCCTQLSQAPMTASLSKEKPEITLSLADEAPAMLLDGRKTYFSVVDIAKFKGAPYILRIQSSPSFTGFDRLLFPIKVDVLDEAFNPIKTYSGTDWLTRRGSSTEGIISFAADTKAHYLLVYSDKLGLTTTESASSISTTPIFVGVGVVNMPTGFDKQVSTFSSPTGKVLVRYEP